MIILIPSLTYCKIWLGLTNNYIVYIIARLERNGDVVEQIYCAVFFYPYFGPFMFQIVSSLGYSNTYKEDATEQ